MPEPIADPKPQKSTLALPTVGGLIAAFLAVILLPSLVASAGQWAAPLIAVAMLAAGVLIFAPGFALLTLVGKHVPAGLAPGVVLVGSATAGWLVFWSWFLSPAAGMLGSLAVLAATVLILALRPTADARRLVQWPALVSILISVGYLALAGDRGGLIFGEQLIAGRFWAVMDNALPRIMADGLMHGGEGLKPFMFTNWHSSDRPPLQTGLVLFAYPFVKAGGGPLCYLILSLAVNAFWVWGVWGFLRVLGVAERRILLAVLLVALVGAVYVNTIYTWPKMLAGALALTTAAAMLAPHCQKRTRWLLVAAACAFSMLSHGASVFAILGLLPLGWVRRHDWPLRTLFLTGCVMGLIYVPWMAYQKFYDPPGDRLVKWHLAGIEQLDEGRPVGTAMVEAYRTAGFSGYWQNRLHNLRTLVGDPTDWNGTCPYFYAEPGWNDTEVGHWRHFFLLRLGPAPAILLVGLPFLCLRRIRSAVWFKPVAGILFSTLFFLVLLEFGSTPSCVAWLFVAPYSALLLWCLLGALTLVELGESWGWAALGLQLILFVGLWDYHLLMWSACQQPAEPGHVDWLARAIAAGMLAILVGLVFHSRKWPDQPAISQAK